MKQIRIADYFGKNVFGVTLLSLLALSLSYLTLAVQERRVYLEHMKIVGIELQKDEAKSHVLRSRNYIDFIRKNTSLTRSEKQDLALRRLSDVRFGKSGYIFIFQVDGTLLLSLGQRDIVGENLLLTGDSDARRVFDEGLAATADNNEGFIEYRWGKPDEAKLEEKISYVLRIPDWDWVVGGGVYLDDLEGFLSVERALFRNRFFYESGAILVFFILVLSLSVGMLKRYERRIRSDTRLFGRFLGRTGEGFELKSAPVFRFIEFQTLADKLVEKIKDLASSEKKYREIVSNANSAIIKHDDEGRITFFNECAERIFGFSSEEVVGKKGIETINTPDQEALMASVIEAPEKYETHENMNRRKDGRFIWVSWTNKPLQNERGRKIGILSIANDITETKKAYETIQKNLREKEVLLKEIHHRVKNNLQIIISLLRLHEESMDLPEADSIFRETENRIHSIALLHELLHESDNLVEIRMDDYIRRLIPFIARSYEESPSLPVIESALDEVLFDVDRAMSGGLLFNELLSNALRHAFPEDRPAENPKIRISLYREEGECILEVADNGVGMDEEPRNDRKGGVGLSLVDALAKQLHAVFDLQTKKDEGTRTTVRIPV